MVSTHRRIFRNGYVLDGGVASLAQCLRKLFSRNLCLAQNASKRADLDLAVHRDNAAFGFSFHDHVASTLAQLLEPQPFQRTLNLGA